MKAEILKLLKENDGYVSGQEICSRLNVSRTAVWKVINQLREEGYTISAVRNKGYRLIEGADVLTQAELISCMDHPFLGGDIEYYDETDSTNDQVRRLAEDNFPEGTLVVAEHQTSGKGRKGRSWVSPPGTGIWMSFLLRPDMEPDHASMLTLVSALAVSDGIADACGLKCGIKWPNDIVSSGKKVCGILTEMSTELEMIRYIIVGIGINVNTVKFPEDISNSATSVFLETGTTWKRSDIIACIMKRMEEYYNIFLKTYDLSFLKDIYESKLVNLGREVTVLTLKGDPEFCGICRGIDERGELLIELKNGDIKEVSSGEVSVRGIYGYV